MKRRVYEVDDTEQPPIAPEFDLGGQVFVCKTDRDVSSLDVLDLLAGMTGEDGLERVRAMLRLFREFLPSDDGKPQILDREDPTKIVDEGVPSTMERFRDTVLAKRVRLMLLNDIAAGVLDDYLRFPTAAAGPSSNGSTTAASSNGAVSSPEPDLTSTT